MMRSKLGYEEANELFSYSAETGVITTRRSLSAKKPVGSVLGAITRDGYLQIGLRGRFYMAHRLAFLLMDKEWPSEQVDHINGIRTDNSWRNLRHATAGLNAQNKRVPQSNNRSGFLGVTKFGRGWRASITVMRKQVYLGTFGTPEEAFNAYLRAKRAAHEGCTI
jgi:hypothetical protein